jgi:hypothetical protein
VAAGIEDPSVTTASSATSAINDKTSGKYYAEGDEAMPTQALSRLSICQIRTRREDMNVRTDQLLLALAMELTVSLTPTVVTRK